jgi:1-acyl-sn-glycerol-3-phosphate acyltransferase
MSVIRATVRLTALAAVTFGAYVILMALRVVALPLRVSKGSRARLQARMLRKWSRAVCAILDVHIEPSGLTPSRPFLLVSNHLSYLDVVIIASTLDCVFVAKNDVARWPIIGQMCRSVGTIFVDRENRRDLVRANELIKEGIESGRAVVLFPEGTSSPGSSVLPFRPSLLEQAARSVIPVHYAAIRYRVAEGDPPEEQSVCWWGTMTFFDHFWRMLRLRAIEARIAFGLHAIRATDRKALARRLWDSVNRLFLLMETRDQFRASMTSDSDTGFSLEGECKAATR